MKYFHKVIIKTVPASANRNIHWAKVQKNRDLWHDIIIRAFRFKPEKPVERCVIHIVFYSNREMDYDNLVWRCKPVFDGLVKAGIIKDDNMRVVLARDYQFVKVPKKEARISIEVEELVDNPGTP